MQRQFGDHKISRRTEGPEGDFVEMDANTSKYLYNYFMGMRKL